jgi:SsrA-binding protein
MKLIAQNKKAYRDYYIEETFQTGIALAGTEVKSLRLGKCSLKESYVKIKNGETFLINAHISPYEQGNIFNKDPFRERKLLLHKKQIYKLLEASVKDGYTIVQLKIYFNGSLVKVDIAVAKGKKLYDKREALAKKDAARDLERAAAKFQA